jgi:hypothetical protein
MTKNQIIAIAKFRLNELNRKGYADTELDHKEADKILCEVLIALGQQEIVDLFNKINKWYA